MNTVHPTTVITGGSRGIGRAVALRLAADGHNLVIGYARDAAAADAVASEIRALGRACRVFQVDVADAASVRAFFAEAEAATTTAAASATATTTVAATGTETATAAVSPGATLGPITGVVANAGAIRATGRLAELDPADIEADLRVNLLGTILTCQAAIPSLTTSRGSIVTIGSAAVASGSPNTYVHYAAAKAGVAVCTEGLARELAPQGIRVNCVEPGTVWTDFHEDPNRPAKVAERIPMARAGEPEEIAGAVAWLLSADAGYATGATIRVAGGI